MKTTVFLLLFSAQVVAQYHTRLEPATIEVHYRHTMQRDTVRRLATETDSMILRIGARASQFFSRHTFYYDSLWNDPEGRATAEALTLEAFRTRDHSKEPRVGTTYDYLYKNYPAGRVTTTNEQFHVACRYNEATPSISWGMADSIRMILGHPCRMATADFRGRHWTAWFATDIPVSDGPWKLGGLPGLILEAYDEGRQHVFTAVGLERVKDELIIFNRPFRGNHRFEQTNRLEFLRMERRFLMDSNSFIQMETGIDLLGDEPNQVMRYDLLERDY